VRIHLLGADKVNNLFCWQNDSNIEINFKWFNQPFVAGGNNYFMRATFSPTIFN